MERSGLSRLQDAWFALCKNTPGFSQKCPAWNASKLKETRIPEWRSAVCFVFCAYKQGFFTNKAVLFGLWRVLFFISMGLSSRLENYWSTRTVMPQTSMSSLNTIQLSELGCRTKSARSYRYISTQYSPLLAVDVVPSREREHQE